MIAWLNVTNCILTPAPAFQLLSARSQAPCPQTLSSLPRVIRGKGLEPRLPIMCENQILQHFNEHLDRLYNLEIDSAHMKRQRYT